MRFAGIAAREPISGLELVAPEPTTPAALSRVHERFVLAGDTSGPTLSAWDSSRPTGSLSKRRVHARDALRHDPRGLAD